MNFLIAGSAPPNFTNGSAWYSQGTIFRTGRLGSIVKIKHIKEPCQRYPLFYRPKRI
jgi:hypothetical protein